jgi:hypothetical protein
VAKAVGDFVHSPHQLLAKIRNYLQWQLQAMTLKEFGQHK